MKDIETEFIEDLYEASRNVLLEHPGCDMESWMEFLFEEYPTEVVDALGVDEDEVMDNLREIWREISNPNDTTKMNCFITN